MKNIKILVACEESGEVRDAFRARGFDAWSCDMADSRTPSEFHIKRDVMEVLAEGWDCLIGFPPCTYLANSSVQWLTNIPKNPNPKILYGPPRVETMKRGAAFFLALWNSGIKHVALENPIMHGPSTSTQTDLAQTNRLPLNEKYSPSALSLLLRTASSSAIGIRIGPPWAMLTPVSGVKSCAKG